MKSFTEKLDRTHDREPWAALAKICGLRPSQTEDQTRSAFSKMAGVVSRLEGHIEDLETRILCVAEVNGGDPMLERLHRLSKEVREDRSSRRSVAEFPVVFQIMQDWPHVEVSRVKRSTPLHARGTIDGTPFLLVDDGASWTLSVGQDPDGNADWTHRQRHPGSSPVLDALKGKRSISDLVLHWQNVAIRRLVEDAITERAASAGRHIEDTMERDTGEPSP